MTQNLNTNAQMSSHIDNRFLFQFFPSHLVQPSPCIKLIITRKNSSSISRDKFFLNYKLSKHILDSYNCLNLLSPLVYTIHIESALILFEKMFKEISDQNKVKFFVLSRLNSRFINNGKIKADHTKSLFMLNISQVNDLLNSSNSSFQFKPDNSTPQGYLSNQAGVYIYKDIKSDKFYVGSALSFINRHKSHKDELRKNKSLFNTYVNLQGGWSSFYFYHLYLTPNLLHDFKLENPFYKLNKGEILFLVHISELI